MSLKKNLLLLLVLTIFVGVESGQSAIFKKKAPAKTEAKTAVDSTKKKPAPMTIPAVIKSSAKSSDGLFKVYVQDEKYYFLVPLDLINRDMMLVNRISQAAAGLRVGMAFSGYAGDPINGSMVRLTRSPNGSSIFLRSINTTELQRDSTEMHTVIERNNMQPIMYTFPIVAYSAKKDSALIEVTDFINSDNEMAGFDPGVKSQMELSSFQKDKSYITGVKTLPINIEMRSVKTYMLQRKPAPGTSPVGATPVTMEINSSLVLLPETPMQPRYYDDRVGYFTERYVDFDKDPTIAKSVYMITRYRLEPKPEDLEKYKRGELVEPAKQIVYYIDPATPAKFVPYLIEGVNAWQGAFEQAGFKNAIVGKVAPTPEEDPTWSLDDARHSAIVYKPSTVANASGPHIHDPRSGEILESHVNWYHNITQILREWYFIQAGPLDPRAQTMVFDDELMGELVKYVATHEVGHTLGLRHNFGASSTYPVDSLRNVAFLRKNNNTPSIMDYARYNYVAQPEDNIPVELLIPQVQQYDTWAIEFGYRRLYDFASATEELPYINKWIIEKNAANPYLWFGTELNPADPRSQNEDLGDNQMKANELGIRNLKRVMAGLEKWTATPNEDYANLSSQYKAVVSQYRNYVGHVAKWMGGIYETPKTIEQGGVIYSYVDKAKQQEAMKWLAINFFKPQTWLIDRDIYAKTGTSEVNTFDNIYRSAMMSLLSTRVIQSMIMAENADGNKAYTVTMYFNDLNANVWGELSSGANPDLHRRLMQKNYVAQLKQVGNPLASDDVRAVASYQLRQLMNRLNSASSSNPIVKAHYQYLAADIKRYLDPK